jgi:hypothetical protein
MSDNYSGGRNGLLDILFENQDEVVTIFTEGCVCFTGLLCDVNCEFCKLITKGSCGCPGSNNCFGKVTIIPLNQITAVTLCNTGR